jgi:hypothetical protein
LREIYDRSDVTFINDRTSTIAGRPGLRFQGSRLWAWAVALLVVAQLGLLLHQHHPSRDLYRGGDECTLCQVVSTLGAGPAAPVLVLPVFVVLGAVVLPVHTALRAARLSLSFRSRAPPASIRT